MISSLTPECGSEIVAQLDGEKQALESFIVSLEQEFLGLGALLRKIVHLAREVRDRSDEIIEAAAGRTEDAAIQFAFQLLKKAEDLVQASREQHQNVYAVFERMHLDLIQVTRERSSLMMTLSPLDTIKIQFRIQACAFDEKTRAQFFAVADAIAQIVADVQTAVGQRFQELERAGQTTGELVAELAATSAAQKGQTEGMLAESRDHLSMLGKVLLSSGTAAESISEAGAKIAGGVSRAIMALQCQDMARQKFQHIGDAIDEMMAHLDGEAAGEDRDRFLADAGCVQLAQLQSVFDQLDEAAQEVRGGLREVDTEAKAFADYAQRSGGATLDGEIIGRAVESIRAVLAVIENAVANVRTVGQLVVKLKSTFSDGTAQILELARRLRVAALNAQIFASHVEAGTALEVVARSTRAIADDAMRQLGEISSRVTQVVDLVTELEQRLGDHRELADMERDLLAVEATESEEKLRALESGLRSSVAAIGPLEGELSQAVRQTTESIRFPEAVAEARGRSTAFFHGIVLEHSGSISRPGSGAHEKVQGLKSNYTMAHERDVHEFAMVRFGGAGATRIPEPIGVVEEGLADNVELF